jgi:hypothetical protein
MASTNPSLLVVFVNEKYDNYLQRLELVLAQLIGCDYKADRCSFIPSSSLEFPACCHFQTVDTCPGACSCHLPQSIA